MNDIVRTSVTLTFADFEVTLAAPDITQLNNALKFFGIRKIRNVSRAETIRISSEKPAKGTNQH